MLTQVYDLLIGTLFHLYILVVFLRFLLQASNADFYNPVSQFAVKATDPVLVPLRKIIPALKNIDFAALLFILLLKLFETGLTQLVHNGGLSSIYWIFALSIVELVSMAIYFYLFAIFVQIIISWIAPQNFNPAIALLYQLTDPIMAPARKLLPPMGGMDFSPIIVLLGLQILHIILVSTNNSLLPMLFGAMSTFFV